MDSAVFEPVERLSVDVPEEYLGTVTSLISVRRGRMESMTNHGTGWVRLEFVVPARGPLIGFRTQFLTETRGTGIMHHVFEGYEPWSGAMRGRATGSLVSEPDESSASAYAMFNLQERGSLFVAPGTEVYEGMIIRGELPGQTTWTSTSPRERKMTNVRQSTGEEHRATGAAAAAQPGAGARVLQRRRVRGGDRLRAPPAQDRPGRQGSRAAPAACRCPRALLVSVAAEAVQGVAGVVRRDPDHRAYRVSQRRPAARRASPRPNRPRP